MRCNSVVPECHIMLSPLESYMRFLGCCDEFVEIADDGITLSLGDPNNFGHKTRVEENRLPPSHGIDSDEWMLSRHRFSAYRSPASSRVVRLHVG